MTLSEVARVLPATARTNRAGHLEIGGCDAVDLAREHGTPLFVCDLADVRTRVRRYAQTFGARNVQYASKAFLTRPFAAILAEEGVGMDCASGGELYTALAAGFPAERIVLHGNNKSEAELAMAVDAGVGRVVVDSDVELRRLERVASERGREVSILIRVTPGIEAHTHEYLKTGIEDTKFGVPIGQPALAAVQAAAEARCVRLTGLHSHIGSQIFDLQPFVEAANVMVAFLARCREVTGLSLPELDLGGGLGIPYVVEDAAPEIEDLGKVVLEAVADAAERASTPVPDVQVEPGRSIVGPAMVTLYEVGTVKQVPGLRSYVSVDGGMSDNLRPMLYGAVYTFLSATRPDALHDREYAISGKLCETGDVLRKDAMLPEARPGDVIAVAATGAYCYAMASNYNKQPKPAVLGVADGDVTMLARRETYEDLLRLEG